MKLLLASLLSKQGRRLRMGSKKERELEKLEKKHKKLLKKYLTIVHRIDELEKVKRYII